MPGATHTAWTEAQRRNSRAEYARLYASNHGRKGSGLIVPEDIVRLASHEPCWRCCSRDGCVHRPWLAVANG